MYGVIKHLLMHIEVIMNNQDFLDEIAKDPYNEQIRIVYADWLEECDEYDEAIRQRKFIPAYKWLRNFADEWYFDFNELIYEADREELANNWGRYVVAHGVDLHSRGELGEDHDIFWQNLSIYTGKQYTQEHIDTMGWSCSC